MKQLIAFIYFTCACMSLQAQVNYVKNPSLEDYSKCPNAYDQIIYARYWSTPLDSTTTSSYQMEYYNTCAGDGHPGASISSYFWEKPYFGNGMAGAVFYYDKKPPYPMSPIPRNYRDYLQGRFLGELESGKQYCVCFYVILSRESRYAHNKIGALIDNGSFDDTVTIPGSEMTFVMPQVYTDSVVGDTAHWFKIEGSFTAKGGENYITIGNFFENSDVTALSTDRSENYSYYGIDDISVIPLDLSAEAGADTWVGKGDSVQIGRIGDTTAHGLDCKWYHKGSLIDSGAIIWAKGFGLVGDKDTYAVVQTICGLVKTDTVVVYTVPTGIHEIPKSQQFNIYPNPSNGTITISNTAVQGGVLAKVYDPSGRLLISRQLQFKDNTAQLHIQSAPGVYVLELTDEAGNKQYLQLLIREAW